MVRGVHWDCADDLTFNYHLILRMCAGKWRLSFFPLTWREEDQVSNVRLVRQTRQLIETLCAFVFKRAAYLNTSYALRSRDAYQCDVLWNGSEEV
jgi:hypothetical protein